ncbi:Zinc finger protein 737 [Chionoecetes opilio]|uniref:Zinc finger protein 737 n=1 Tax=Chionoecetes opilio TaxID=41210 RepID=A0A8J4XZA2_CHIOP|nr:Zinc finger protein 737 [Chionoecetes opilio]
MGQDMLRAKRSSLCGESVTRFKCEECGKQLTQKSHLKSHKLIHSGEKTNECNECGEYFIRKADLKSHKITHTPHISPQTPQDQPPQPHPHPQPRTRPQLPQPQQPRGGSTRLALSRYQQGSFRGGSGHRSLLRYQRAMSTGDSKRKGGQALLRLNPPCHDGGRGVVRPWCDLV